MPCRQPRCTLFPYTTLFRSDVENIVRRLRQHRLSGSKASTAKVILDASLEVRSPIVYATLIIVAASLPVLLLQGLRSEEHTSELQSRLHLVCRRLLEKKIIV